jgi:ubiquinone/menaquinone biosynthesis C-methylase UbiE
MIETNNEYIKSHDIKNITLLHAAANELSEHVEKNSIDVIIINSVIQYFETTDYLEKVLNDLMAMLKPNGVLFIGDVRDADKWEDYVEFLKKFHENFDGGEQKIEKNLRSASKELFLSRSYFETLKEKLPKISKIEISDKIGTIENEFTLFRFDVLIVKG